VAAASHQAAPSAASAAAENAGSAAASAADTTAAPAGVAGIADATHLNLYIVAEAFSDQILVRYKSS